MSYIDFLLNIVGVLLWINWRSLGFVSHPPALSLVTTVRPAEKKLAGRWVFLALLGGLVVLRSLFYWQMGGPLDWTPKLPLGILVISFRCDAFWRYLLFSSLSFGLCLAVLYMWLLLLSAINRKEREPGPIQKLVQLHLGWVGRWPAPLQLVLPFVFVALCWPAVHWLLASLEMIPPLSGWPLMRQALGLSLAVILVWSYLLIVLLALHFLNSYIYFGSSPFWNFVALSGRNLLWPLRWLHLGKMDLAPLVGIALLLVISERLAKWPEWWPALADYLKLAG